MAPKTPASVREVPLVEQLGNLLAAHKQATPFAAPTDWVFATGRGTPHGYRNVAQRVLRSAADGAQLNGDGWPPLRFHDLRHTFASHLIVATLALMLRRSAVSSATPGSRSPSTSTPTSLTTPVTRARFGGGWQQVTSRPCLRLIKREHRSQRYENLRVSAQLLRAGSR